jgi:acyl-CoA oxidase
MATTSRSGSGPEDEESTPAMRRLRRLSLHLLQPSDRPAPEGANSLVVPAACAGKRRAGGLDADAAALTAYLRGRHRALQARVYEFYVARPELQTPVELPTAAHRELCFRQMSALVRDAGVRPLSLMASDPSEYFAVMEAVGGLDISLAIKVGVQYRFVRLFNCVP